MKGITLIVIGILFVAAGITGLVHPQWQGRDKPMDVYVNNQRMIVTTRRITNVPPTFSACIIVMGLCTAALGGVTRAKARAAK